jgi:putative ABC transport system permease protein
MRSDIKFAVRSLLRSPGFTAVALATLAVGFGATTAMFVAVREVVLDPLPFPEQDRIVHLYERRPHQGRERNVVSLPDYIDWHAANLPVFDGMALYTFAAANLTSLDRPEALEGAAVRGRFFDILGIEPAMGRVFTENEQGPASPRLVILSHGIWQRLFGGAPGILHTTIQFDSNPYTVIGIMPEGRAYPFESDFWVPLRDDPATASRGSHGYDVVARLAPGVSIDRAFRDLNVVAERLEEQYPESNAQHYANVVPLGNVALGQAPAVLWLLLGAVGFVLLIVATNVANMQLARGLARQREFAIRTSIGASRGRIVRQLLTENAVLGVAGGMAGLVVAWWLTGLLEPRVLAQAPWLSGLRVDVVTGVLAPIGAVAVALCFGAVPAFACSRFGYTEALRDGIRSSRGVGHTRVRNALVVVEIAVALLLLVGAGLTTRSLQRLVSIDPGFEPDRVLSAFIALPSVGYDSPERRLAFFDRLEEVLESSASVESAGYTWLLPFTPMDAGRNFTIEGREPPASSDAWNARWRIADAPYFETMQIPLLSGRMFEPSDRTDAPPVALVNRTMAEAFWPDGAIGARFRLSSDQPWSTIIGVVGDVRHQGLDQDLRPEFYMPRSQVTPAYGAVVVRGRKSAAAIVPTLRAAVQSIDPNLPISEVSSMREHVDDSFAQRRVTASIVAAFGITALILAAMGVYGVLAYAVGQRSHEIGVRMALGGRAVDVLRLFLGEGMRVVGIGLALGVAGALVLTRFIDSFLFGIGSTDFVSFAAAAAVLAGTAVVAILAPAQRATKVAPMVSFRAE